MPKAISNTSPLLYLHRINAIDWLAELFEEIWVPSAVVEELQEGENRGYNVPHLDNYPNLQIVSPQNIPENLENTDLGSGEQAAIALALENRDRIVLLDDALARTTARNFGLTIWGTLKILLEAKDKGLIERIKPCVDRLQKSGMWISNDIRQRVLNLAGE